MQISKSYVILFIFCTLFLATICEGQSINIYCKEKADSLIKSGIDTVIYYQPFVSPLTQEANDCCMIYERRYLLWKKGRQLFVLKHYDYYDIEKKLKGKNIEIFNLMDTLGIFKFLNNNFLNIVSEKLLPAKLQHVENNKIIIEDYSIIHGYDDAYTQISIFINGKIYQNGFMGDDLNDGTDLNSDGTLRMKKESLNYQSNINKAIYKLIEKITRQTASFN